MSNVLILEDDFRVRTFLSFVLDEDGFVVKEAENESDAISLVRNDPEGIDLVLLGQEQLPTLAALRRLNPDLRCCLLSPDFSGGRLHALGALAVFAKPVADPARFVRNVRQLSRVPLALPANRKRSARALARPGSQANGN
jgi:CheY-like chemotaxis protein